MNHGMKEDFRRCQSASRCVFITVTGAVQGVGFRPFVYRTARKLNLTGTVQNTGAGVEINACGLSDAVAEFVQELQTNHPPLARIASCTIEERPLRDDSTDFSIIKSRAAGKSLVDCAPDTAPCQACLSELYCAADRRYNHPFINCTDCGPRFTIIRRLPYDRHTTTMAHFPLCPKCSREYGEASDRRFHAQPVCCPDCGPAVFLTDACGTVIASSDPIARAVSMLEAGSIIAVKAAGGFHLACRADDCAAVQQLRSRKSREAKPFAVMVGDMAAARRYGCFTQHEAAMVQSPQRPIVLVQARSDTDQGLAPLVAPNLTTIGIMLPSTPLHYLLFRNAAYDCLVMTSANRSHELLCTDNEEALSRLATIADAFLMHNREIHVAIDDSVIRLFGDKPVFYRRARGFVPQPIAAGSGFVDKKIEDIVGLGGIAKKTICIARPGNWYVSHYLGSGGSVDTIENAQRMLDHFSTLFAVQPRLYVMDQHHGQDSEKLAPPSAKLMRVQHHHSHFAACMAENDFSATAIGVVYDGLGMGDDGTLWGGEIFIGDYRAYERAAHWARLPLVGGDNATQSPGRIAVAALAQSYPQAAAHVCPWMDAFERSAVLSMIESDISVVWTSSMGRLFDACSALLGIGKHQTYEAQAAIELEAAIDMSEKGFYAIEMKRDEQSRLLLDSHGLLAAVYDDVLKGETVGAIATRFHRSVSKLTACAVGELMASRGLKTVCLSGGCFQNRFLFKLLYSELERLGATVLFHRQLSPGDECISLGQCAIAAHRKRHGDEVLNDILQTV